jgi:hypothetical protein
MRFNADDICLQVIDNRPHLCFRFPADETHQVVAKTAQLKDFIAKNKEVRIDVNKMTEERSLNANNYMWALCSKLAEKLSNEKVKYVKEDIYRKEIKEAGIWADDEIEPEKVKWRCKAWEQIGTGWITERVDFSADGNKEVIRFYYGSSRYNKSQMQRLLNNLVQDCQAVGIETKTPDEIANLISLWEQAK